MNNTSTISQHIQHYFSAMKLSFWIRLWRFIIVNPLPFACKIIVCDPFSSPVMTSWRNGSFLCLERRLVTIDKQSKRSALFFSLRACGTQTSSLLTFHIFSKWRPMVDCDVFSLSANSRLLRRGLHSTLRPPIFATDKHSLQFRNVKHILSKFKQK